MLLGEGRFIMVKLLFSPLSLLGFAFVFLPALEYVIVWLRLAALSSKLASNSKGEPFHFDRSCLRPTVVSVRQRKTRNEQRVYQEVLFRMRGLPCCLMTVKASRRRSPCSSMSWATASASFSSVSLAPPNQEDTSVGEPLMVDELSKVFIVGNQECVRLRWRWLRRTDLNCLAALAR